MKVLPASNVAKHLQTLLRPYPSNLKDKLIIDSNKACNQVHPLESSELTESTKASSAVELGAQRLLSVPINA